MPTPSVNTTQLAVRSALTVVFVVATILGFVVGRPVVGFVLLCFALFSLGTLAAMVRKAHE